MFVFKFFSWSYYFLHFSSLLTQNECYEYTTLTYFFFVVVVCVCIVCSLTGGIGQLRHTGVTFDTMPMPFLHVLLVLSFLRV